jgi:hypothetical protein
VFDVTGYYTADATGLRYVPLTPASLSTPEPARAIG